MQNVGARLPPVRDRFSYLPPLTEFCLHKTLRRPHLRTNMETQGLLSICGRVSLQTLRQRMQSARRAVGTDKFQGAAKGVRQKEKINQTLVAQAIRNVIRANRFARIIRN